MGDKPIDAEQYKNYPHLKDKRDYRIPERGKDQGLSGKIDLFNHRACAGQRIGTLHKPRDK